MVISDLSTCIPTQRNRKVSKMFGFGWPVILLIVLAFVVVMLYCVMRDNFSELAEKVYLLQQENARLHACEVVQKENASKCLINSLLSQMQKLKGVTIDCTSILCASKLAISSLNFCRSFVIPLRLKIALKEKSSSRYRRTTTNSSKYTSNIWTKLSQWSESTNLR